MQYVDGVSLAEMLRVGPIDNHRAAAFLRPVALAVAEGQLDSIDVSWYNRKAVCVVMASGGYPGSYEKGKPVTGLEEAREELAAAGLEVERGDTQSIIAKADVGGLPIGNIVRFGNGDVLVSGKKGSVRSSDGGRTWTPVESGFCLYACRLANGDTIQFSRRDKHAVEPPSPDEDSDRPGWIRCYGWLLRAPAADGAGAA